MNYWIVALSLVGILSTAVVWGTDVFFLVVGRSALRSATPSAGTEVMGYIHMFADARMPTFGASAIVSNLLLILFSAHQKRWFYALSLLTLLSFLAVYGRLSKPINRLQTEAAIAGRTLDNARELQLSWDKSLRIRVPLLAVSLLAQCLVSLISSSQL